MGITAPLSPALVAKVIADEEIPRRRLSFPAPLVTEVFRYGAATCTTIHRHAELARGMARAREMIAECERQDRSFASGQVLVVDRLTGSRGRFQRPWHAPAGGLWMTVILVNTLLPVSTGLYTMAAGAAAGEAIAAWYPSARVKWVNDVHAGGRKICGILTETMRGPVSREEYILLGLGINVNNEEFPPELSSQAVSLRQLLGREVDIESLAVLLLAKLAWHLGLLHFEERRLLAESSSATLADPDEYVGFMAGRQHLLVAGWLGLSDTIGRRVLFGYDVQQRPLFEGVAEGVRADGSLLIRLPDGSLACQNSGEIVYLD